MVEDRLEYQTKAVLIFGESFDSDTREPRAFAFKKEVRKYEASQRQEAE